MTHAGPAAAAVDPADLLRLGRDLVRINSINPSLVEGAPGEAAIAQHVAREMEQLGLEVTCLEPAPGRVSVLGRRPGIGGGRSLMLNAHLDTVGVEGMPDPFSGDVRDGRLHGRGSYDMKGSLACCLAAARALRDAGIELRGDLLIAAVADEEYGSLGTTAVLERVAPDGAIVTEPTGLDVCLAHKGYLWIEVRTEGRAAHGSRFDEGVDANLRMGRFLARLEGLERELRARTRHPLVGPPSLHAALLQGGSGLSTYASECRLQIERRSVPGETEASVMGEITALLDGLRGQDPAYQASARTFFAREPFEVSPDAELVRVLAGAAARVSGAPPRFIGDTPWMDAALCAGAGVETVVFGPAGAGAHADVEWVDVESLVRCARTLAETAAEYCG